LSSIIRKVYHVRKYDNIEYELKRKAEEAANDTERSGNGKILSAV